LYIHVLSGTASVELTRLSPPPGVYIRPFLARDQPVVLTGTPVARRAPPGIHLMSVESLEPQPLLMRLEHRCVEGKGGGVARAVLRVHGHTPVHLMWKVACSSV